MSVGPAETLEPAGPPDPSTRRRGGLAPALGVILLLALAGGLVADRATGWVDPAFRFLAQLFFEKSPLAEIRQPGQLTLARFHGAIALGLVGIGLLASPRLSCHGRRWWAVFCVAYTLRALAWIVGGNLPLVPGDSSHYVEVAASVYRGEGAVKHYVESYFRDYPAIARGEGVLDDWATPLWAYLLAAVYRLVGVVPLDSIEASFAVAKGTSFVLNLLTLPLLYAIARRSFGPTVALASMATAAVLPVHAIYAGFALRESLVALTSVAAVGLVVEMIRAPGRSVWGWAVAAGVAGGLAILARNTAMALMAACALSALLSRGRRALGPLVVMGGALLVVIAPWAWRTWSVYGEPFYTYTKYFPYNFSWTVHHYEQGNTRPGQFYTAANAPSIARIKLKAVLIIGFYSTMILGPPLALAAWRRLTARPGDPATRAYDRTAFWLALTFVVATLVNVADVTQVQQLGRYYLPVYLVLIPPAVAALLGWLRRSVAPAAWPLAFGLAVLWPLADPTWAHDTTWLSSPYQLRWPAIRAAGDWVRTHPEQVPPGARILTWFPWEFRVASDRTTVLFPRALEGGERELQLINQAIRKYGVTHILWGSFEPAPHQDPEVLGPYLESMRQALGLTDSRLIHRTQGLPYGLRLYRLEGARP